MEKKDDNVIIKKNLFEIKKEIKPKDQEQGFLYERMENIENNNVEKNIELIKKKLNEDIDFLKEEKEKIKKDEEFFTKKGFMLSDKACERMVKLIHYIENKIPVLLEGPTGTSKTRTTLIACDYLKYKKNKNKEENEKDKKDKNEEENDNLLRFNLSRETKIDDLLEKFIGDQNSPAGLKVEKGLFMKAYSEGYKLLLDEINLAKKDVLECIQQALDNKVLSFDCNGKGYVNIPMHPNFSIIATQNPNKGEFEGKRQDLGIGFLSRFQKINFPDFDKNELIDITKKLAKNAFSDKNNTIKDELLEDIVNFHIDCKENSLNDVQCFTIREIESVITALSNGENCYQTLITVYASRYEKDKKKIIESYMSKYPNLRNLKKQKLKIPKNFPHCYINENLIETSNAVLFSLKNKRNVIIVGKDESGLTTIARWCAKCFIQNNNNNNLNIKEIICFCTSNLQCSDMIGSIKPTVNNKLKNNEMLIFKQGFLYDAILNGNTVIFDSINEVSSTVCERLNGLLDKKNNEEEEYFEVPENSKESKIKIHSNFRIICTANIEKISSMSPAFINRFDVIVLENQIENINENNLLNLISYLYISFDRIPKKNQIFEKMNKNYNFQNPFEGGEDDDNNEKEDIEETEDNIIIKKKN